jgi:uncharacterized phage protein (TIGR01671 family)
MDSRKIKFKIWDNLKKEFKKTKWCHPIKLNEDGYGIIEHPQGCKYLQFTGLTDNNGKEIYEGDVVSFDEPTKLCEGVYMATLYVFDFYNGSFLNPYIYNSINGSKFIKMEPSSLNPVGRAKLEGNQKFDWTKAEIRGNIYENPELVDR